MHVTVVGSVAKIPLSPGENKKRDDQGRETMEKMKRQPRE